MSEASRKEMARLHLDAAEAWLRRLIDLKLTAGFDAEYLHSDPEGWTRIGNGMRRRIASRYLAEPSRFARRIDASDLDDVIKILFYKELYSDYFQDALDVAYSGSRDLARSFLRRIFLLRNKLAHGSVCSQRDLEQAVCYSNDLINSIKSHLKSIGMDRTFNVPRFIRVFDNLGNDRHLSPLEGTNFHIIDLRPSGTGEINVGDELAVEVEVDPSFDGYKIVWMTFAGDHDQQYPLRLKIENRHAGEQLLVRLQLKSKEDWHRLHAGWDDMIDLTYRVPPPVKK